MKRFADLYDALDRTTSTNAKVAAMVDYFRAAPPDDAAWAVFILTGRRFKRLLNTRQLVDWTLALTKLPEWMFTESYGAVGDLAETIALLLDEVGPGVDGGPGAEVPLRAWIEERVLPLRDGDAAMQQVMVTSWWRTLGRRERYVLCKLLTGELRVGVSQTLVVRALAEVAGVPADAVAHRLMGHWTPTPAFFAELVSAEAAADERSQIARPYPFYLASPLLEGIDTLGDRAEWLAEWKWDGIRSQVIHRRGEVHIWSRGEELITDRFPEVRDAAAQLPDGVVVDGEIMAFDLTAGSPLPFAVLQRRIGRQKLSDKILAEAPAALVAYDLLELNGADIRERPLLERRAALADLVAAHAPRIRISPTVEGADWPTLAARRREARERQVEGLMLKRLTSPYRSGRPRGDWWKWKIEPYNIDAVLIYAQTGSGRRASLFTDYTFGVWSEGALVPVAKAYSGLSDEEIADLDKWIRAHTRERHGPVRVVEPEQVFELHFDGLAPSTRHRSGVALRFPRMARWRHDKPAAAADTLDRVKDLLKLAQD